VEIALVPITTLPPSVSRAIARALFTLTCATAAVGAQSVPPLAIAGVSGTQIGPGGYDADGTRPGAVLFLVKNVSTQSQTMLASTNCNPSFGYLDYYDDDGVFQPAVPLCPSFGLWVTLAAGASGTVAVPLRLSASSSVSGNITLKLAAGSDQPYASVAVASVAWNPLKPTLTATLIPSTYTPAVWPKTSITVPGQSTQRQVFSVYNNGNAPASFTLSPRCTGATTNCTLTSAATVRLEPTAMTYATLVYTAGPAGSVGDAGLVATAPAQASGLVQADTGRIAVTAKDLLAPHLWFAPQGEYDAQAEAYTPLWFGVRDTAFTVDACDEDGTVRTPVLTLNGVNVAPRSTVPAALCASAVRSTFGLSLAPGNNTLQLSVSDGVHTVTAFQEVDYDDAVEQAATFAVHANRTVAIDQVAIDTFVVTNPGPRPATYRLSVVCTPDWTPSTGCGTVTGVPATITLAAHETVQLPFGYRTPGYVGRYVILRASATFTGALTTTTRSREFTATTVAMLPPRATITPASGATTTSPTATISIAWCDPDDNIATYRVTVGAQVLPNVSTVTTVAGCRQSFSSTWTSIALQPWEQTIRATATDDAGHVTTASSTISYLPPLTVFRPDVTPNAASRSYAPGRYSSATYRLTNVGMYEATYALRAVCGGLPNCGTASAVTLAPGATSDVTVNFTSPPASGARDTVRLVATYTAPTGGIIADTGVTAVVAPSVEAAPLVRVSPLAAVLEPTHVGSLEYDITNPGSDPVTFSLASTVTDPFGFPSWFVPPDTVTVAGGATRSVYVSTKAPTTEGAIGTYALRASYVATTGMTLGASASSTVQAVVPRPAIAVYPKNSTQIVYPGMAWNQVAFALANVGNTSSTANATITACTGIAANCRIDPFAFTSSSVWLTPQQSRSIYVDFDDTGATQGSITLRYGDPATIVDSATIRLVRSGPLVTLAVTPKAFTVSANRNRVSTRRFYVQNTGNTTSSVHYLATCWAAPCSSQSKAAATLAANQVDTVDVSFTTRATVGSDSLRFVVAADAPYVAADTGSVRVVVDSIVDIRVNARTTIAGAGIDRAQCLAVALANDSAYECGDLRLVHALPSTTTMNRARTPTLIFNSRHLSVRTLFAADVTIAMGADVTSIVGRVYVSGADNQPVLVASREFPWRPEWSGDTPRRIVVPADLRQFTSGAYHYTLTVDKNTATTSAQASDSGTVAVVNRASSGFGAGWWLDGFETLVTFGERQKLWIGGDGSTRLYTRTPANSDSVWTVDPTLDRPDTLIVSPSGAQYRHLRNGAYVMFDNTGRHRATVSVSGEVTTFNYADTTPGHWSRLTSIDLPVPNGSTAAHRYDFTYLYAAGGDTYLSSVTPPPVPSATRVVTIDHLSGTANISRIASPAPDTSGVRFAYDPTRLTVRTDRAGYSTTFSYDPDAETVTGSRLAMAGTGDDVARIFCASEAASLIACASGAREVSTVRTMYQGPGGARDTTHFVVDRFGAPMVITDALGHVTAIARDDARWPLLATTITRSKLTTRATYTERGLIEREIALNPFDAADRHDTGSDTTVYAWSRGKFDQLDSIVNAAGEVTRFGYDANGDRVWQEDGRGPMSRVRYGYNAYRQLETVQAPGSSSSQVERFDYDARLGNLSRRTSPLGFDTRYHVDAVGRVDSVYAPIDAGQYAISSYQLDVNDRLIVERDYGPSMSYTPPAGTPTSTPALTLVVETRYDAEGRPTYVGRRSEPDANLVGTLTTDWTYDGAGRKLTETRSASPTERWRYDAAGNVLGWTTRRGNEITSGYDALNRIAWRVTPDVRYAAREGVKNANEICLQVPKFPHFSPGGQEFDLLATGGRCVNPNLPPDLLIGRDSAAYRYDDAGQLVEATNGDAQITREYYDNGALKTEIERVAVFDTLVTPISDPFVHRYRLDYRYDRAGRRIARIDSVPRCTGCVQSYHYDRLSGLLDTIADAGEGRPLAHFTFAYDGVGRLIGRDANHGASSESRSFDLDGRLKTRTVIGGGLTVFNDVLEYDAAGRMTSTSIGSDLADLTESSVQVYDGLGALAASSRQRNTLLVDEYVNDALGNRVATRRWSDGATLDHAYHYSREQLDAVSAVQPAWNLGALPPLPSQQVLDTTEHVYDAAGNLTATVTGIARFDLEGAPGWRSDIIGREWTWNAYAADEKLRVSQRSFIDESGTRTVFSEYRYDALGRRVLARSRWDQYCHGGFAPKCQSTLDRVIWDGDQILTELRSDGRSTSEAELTFGNDFLGAVRYTHGADLDEPLAVWKTDVGGLVPHRSWRGTYEAGSGLDGSSLNVNWPSRTRDLFFAPDVRLDTIQATHWLGSLLEGKSEPSGLMYMRNRYYDPKTGRFTQEDPIGLAGGVNRYGFGGGDPVNFSDPFGLCPKSAGSDGKTEEFSDCEAGTSGWYANRIATGQGNRALNEIGGALTSCNESLLCQGVLAVAGNTSVYSAIEEGVEKYVGITRNFAARAAAHFSEKGIAIEGIKGLSNLSRADARAVEQVLIEAHGLGKNGGTLLNKINSIAKDNSIYADALKRGAELLRAVNYPLP
jgi:RHS repeat-associated protein